jgi:hypothetical protein
MRTLLALLLLTSSAIAAPDSSYVAITKQACGPLKAGKRLDEAALRKVFPSATIKAMHGESSTWLITDPATGLRGSATPTFLELEGGKVELYGVEPGDDGSKLAAKPFRGLDCFVAEGRPGYVTCQLPWLNLTLQACTPKAQDQIPVAQLKGCKVQEIWWLPVGRH